MKSQLRDRLKEGDRRIVGAACAVADQVRQDATLLPHLIKLLDDDDTAVVAHTAHALMQIAMDEPARFDPFVESLLDRLEQPRQWEIGEQLPKILVRAALTDAQVERLFGVLAANTRNKSNIVAACSLQGIVDLACDRRIEPQMAEKTLAAALTSDRKALSARARRLLKIVSKL
ncbi:MAG: hypothetical protein GY789_14345 [Hyphomicrobiales bacterium]|nr:hypothetical protein [Hyphomicrobiales bacterium]MCP4998983.1 hypothetical protein [Hyphomicrobiales bacterium]